MTCRDRYKRMLAAALAGLLAAGWAAGAPAPSEREPVANLRLHLRTRVETFKGSGMWDEVAVDKQFSPRETAILICDMWDKHWCRSANQRCGLLAQKMATVVDAARAGGVQIIHAPSDCMDYYKDTPQRRRIAELPRIEPPTPRDLVDPPLPIDASDGGCDDDPPDRTYRAWKREHPALTIRDADVISDNGPEIYSFLRRRGIKHLIVMGVHTNMCVLGRSFAIRQMTRWGVPCILVRDLTDTMYDPKDPPYVGHDQGTELVVQHIEKYWCPSILSDDLIRVPPTASPGR